MPEKNLLKHNVLRLPQLAAAFSFDLPQKLHFLLLGGRPPADGWLKNVCTGKTLWAVDRGIERFRANSIVPQRLIGDADSGSKAAWEWAEQNSVALERHPTAKTYTDTQLALFALGEERGSFAVISGAFGGRLDHAFSTLFSAANADAANCLADEREAVFFVHGGQQLTLSFVHWPTALSLLPLTEKATGVTLTGVRWPLDEAELTASLPFAVSNEATGQNCQIAVGEGTVAVYICFAAE